MSDKVFTMADVEAHNTSESCWIVINGNVYDVSEFLNEHPGGEEVLKEMAGKDATEGFEDVGHSRDAKEMMADYLIGTLAK